MKKYYKKPEISIEDFRLNVFIASCGLQISSVEYSCLTESLKSMVNSMDSPVFSANDDLCVQPAGNDNPFIVSGNDDGTFCYNTPGGISSTTVFSS